MISYNIRFDIYSLITSLSVLLVFHTDESDDSDDTEVDYLLSVDVRYSNGKATGYEIELLFGSWELDQACDLH